jgi:hypothetical protein
MVLYLHGISAKASQRKRCSLDKAIGIKGHRQESKQLVPRTSVSFSMDASQKLLIDMGIKILIEENFFSHHNFLFSRPPLCIDIVSLVLKLFHGV